MARHLGASKMVRFRPRVFSTRSVLTGKLFRYARIARMTIGENPARREGEAP
jgi:hypothetical protein